MKPVFSLRMSEEDKKFIEERAEKDGLKPTVYARQLVSNAITDIKRREAAADNLPGQPGLSGNVSASSAEQGPFRKPDRKWYQKLFWK